MKDEKFKVQNSKFKESQRNPVKDPPFVSFCALVFGIGAWFWLRFEL
jgi:hypothetical protein